MERSYFQNPDLDGSSFLWPSGPTGVLLFHGFTATTVEVRPLAKVLFENGYTVSGPLLPGHGTTFEDSNRQTWKSWAQAAEAAYHELQSNCDHLIVAGSSMGGLLALYLAAKYPLIDGVMLYAPAIRVPGLQYSRFAAPFLQTRPKTYLPENRGDAPPERYPWQGYQLIPVRAAAQFYALQRKVLRLLGKVRQPVLIFQGRLDHTVDPAGAQLAYDRIASERKSIVWLDRSPHTIILSVDFEKVAQISLDFIADIVQQESEAKAG